MSAPPSVPHRVHLASSTCSVFSAHEDSRTTVAPFFIVMKPKAESSTVNNLGVPGAEGIGGVFFVRQFVVGRAHNSFRLVVVHHPQGQVERVCADVN